MARPPQRAAPAHGFAAERASRLRLTSPPTNQFLAQPHHRRADSASVHGPEGPFEFLSLPIRWVTKRREQTECPKEEKARAGRGKGRPGRLPHQRNPLAEDRRALRVIWERARWKGDPLG